MLIVLGVLTAGILFGWLLRQKFALEKWVNYLILGFIFLLLFVLGLEVGSNEKIVSGLVKLGWIAVLISFSAIFFSVLLSWLIYRLFFKSKS